MINFKTEFAWKYHDSTKHSWESVRSSAHFLDWANQPRPYKVYRHAETVSLPRERGRSGRPALSVIQVNEFAESRNATKIVDTRFLPVSLSDLADVLYFSAGITRRRLSPGGEFLFRAAACTGALYSIELYIVSRKLEGLDAGVYLFSPVDLSLKQIRLGDFSGALALAAAGESAVAHAPVTIVATGTYWRNAWKYQARSYRHFGWDNGTVTANLLAVAAARNIPAKVVAGFVDVQVNSLLGLDADREVALSLVPLGYSENAAVPPAGAVPELRLESLPYSPSEIDYPAMQEMHAASCLETAEEVESWRKPSRLHQEVFAPDDLFALKPFADQEAPNDSIEDVILRRGSSRRFSSRAISFRQLSTVLEHAMRGVPADFIAPCAEQLNDVYLVAHAVDGLESGAYALSRNPWGLETLRKGEFRKITGRLGLEQNLPADCSAAVFFLADLNRILGRLGNRGYRAAQLEAGIIGGRLYIAAYAQRLGATGLTFYDDEVTEFFSPHSAGKSAIFLVALGHGERARSFP